MLTGVTRRAAAITFIAAGMLGIAAPAASAAAGPFLAPAPPGFFTPLSNGAGSQVCLEDQGNSAANNSPVVIDRCNGTSGQQWYMTHAGSLLIINGRCLDAACGGTADGTPVQLYTCNGTGSQVWIPQPGGALYNPQS